MYKFSESGQALTSTCKFSEPYYIFLQRLKLLLVVNSVQLVLSCVLVVSSATPPDAPAATPPPHAAEGSLAVLELLVGAFRNGRGLLLFVTFGWARTHYEVMLLLHRLFPHSAKWSAEYSQRTAGGLERASAVWALGM